MNEHLGPIFKIVLPCLDLAGIKYLVFGGVGIAGCVGEFIRPNGDVDIFVNGSDLNKAITFIEGAISEDKNLIFGQRGVSVKIGQYVRPVWEIKDIKTGKEIFSIVPVFVETNSVSFVSGHHLINFPVTILEGVERAVSNYKFTTPATKYIKEIFLDSFRDRKKDWINRSSKRIDAKAILTEDEFKRYFTEVNLDNKNPLLN